MYTSSSLRAKARLGSLAVTPRVRTTSNLWRVGLVAEQEKLQQTLREAQSYATHLETSLYEREAELNTLRHELDELRVSGHIVSQLPRRLQSVELEKMELHEKFAVQRAQCSELATQVADLQVQLAAATTERDQAREERASFLRGYLDIQGEVAGIMAREEDLQNRLQDSERHCASLDSALRSAAVSRDRANMESTDLRQRLEESEASLAEQRELLAQRDVQLKAEMERLAEERHAMTVERRVFQEHSSLSNEDQLRLIADLQVTNERIVQQLATQSMRLGEHHGASRQMKTEIRSLRASVEALEASRRQLHNALQDAKGAIRVHCRVRPGFKSQESAVQVSDAGRVSLAHEHATHNFAFDHVFSPRHSQVEVFSEVDGLVQSALDGYRVCILAYGQTGSGKTHTMQGDEGCAGIIPRALTKIFQQSKDLEARGWAWTLKASFMEVYNEGLRDLLKPRDCGDAAAGHSHEIKRDEASGVAVTNMSCEEVWSMDQIHALMARAAKQRSTASTHMNADSSRSHSIFVLHLTGVNEQENTQLSGSLHLVDLAGSERLHKSGATGERLKETQCINRSLSALADVFAAKAEGRSHVPFRNSKLTQLLEPCLSGQGKTLMLVNVSPDEADTHESLCSLRFARQVSHCDTGGKAKRSVTTASPRLSMPGPTGTSPSVGPSSAKRTRRQSLSF